MKDLDRLSYFLGLEVSRTKQGIFISHKKYTIDLLQDGGVINYKPYKLPMDQHVKLQVDQGTLVTDPETYRRLIGRLIYLTITRPDICFTVQVLSQFMQQPTLVHMQAAKNLLRYLLNNPSQGVLLPNSYSVQLTAYCDSDWESCPMTRRSATRYCILLVNSPISWNLLKDLGIKYLGPVDFKCDNQAAIYIAANPIFHVRTKHIEVDCHYVRNQVKPGIVKPSYVPSKAQVGDVLPKFIHIHNLQGSIEVELAK
ncbi:cysteine-rich receptor-like protein kinase 8 [Tanacetum coccineum]